MKSYLSLIKFSHTVFALPFALIGFFLAVFYSGYAFTWRAFLLMLACMVAARTAAMAFNRYADRDIDRKNPRTACRELPSGILPAGRALLLTVLSSAAFIACAWLLNPLCFYLSPLALAVIIGYSYTKRFTSLSHLVLGAGLSLAPAGAYMAVAGTMDSWLPVLFSLAVLCWVSGFDIIYALQDEDFDRKEGLFSIPASWGQKKALLLSSLLHVITALAVITSGLMAGFGILYWAGTAAFLGMLFYQHLIVGPGKLEKINAAFFTANGMASILFAIFAVLELWLNT